MDRDKNFAKNKAKIPLIAFIPVKFSSFAQLL